MVGILGLHKAHSVVVVVEQRQIEVQSILDLAEEVVRMVLRKVLVTRSI